MDGLNVNLVFSFGQKKEVLFFCLDLDQAEQYANYMTEHKPETEYSTLNVFVKLCQTVVPSLWIGSIFLIKQN